MLPGATAISFRQAGLSEAGEMRSGKRHVRDVHSLKQPVGIDHEYARLGEGTVGLLLGARLRDIKAECPVVVKGWETSHEPTGILLLLSLSSNFPSTVWFKCTNQKHKNRTATI